MSKARAIMVAAVALLIALVAIRAMAFAAPRSHPLHALAAWFQAHPEALAEGGMRSIGGAAAKGETMPEEARRSISRLARKAPLAPEPFLVEGTIAQIAGDQPRAETLFVAARGRDPRSSAARYFLADRYLRTGRIGDGLVELGALSRLSPKAAPPLIPALAAYAKSPGAVDELRRFFEVAPETRGFILSLLAEDPANARLVLALAPARTGGPPPDWQGKMVTAMVNAGDHDGAERVWRRISGIGERGLLFDPQFRNKNAPPPFGWAFASGSAGVAESSGSGGLDVIYYGREPIGLARQLLTLAAGRYELAARIHGQTVARGLDWTMSCVGASEPFATLPLDRASEGRVSGIVMVPSQGCPAQILELRGRPVDGAGTVELMIADLSLVAAGAAS